MLRLSIFQFLVLDCTFSVTINVIVLQVNWSSLPLELSKRQWKFKQQSLLVAKSGELSKQRNANYILSLASTSLPPPFFTAMSIHVTSSPPPAPEINPAPVLNEEQDKAYGIVLKHYSNPSYVIPNVEPAKAALMDEEKLWLVRTYLYLRFNG